MRRGTTLVLVLGAALVLPPAAFAHGLGGVTDLPVPGWLFLVGGAIVLIVSFVALGVLWKEPKLVGPSWPLPLGLSRVVLSSAVTLLLRSVALVLFVVVWSAAAFGSRHALLNIAPVFIYVIFWVGLPVLSVLFGNVWRFLDPWRAVADLVAAGARAVGVVPTTRPYPARLGVRPAVVLLFAFVSLELVYKDPSNTHVLALAIGVYSLATWAGMALFGRETWTRNGDGFALYLNLLSRISLFGRERGNGVPRLVVRRPLSALAFVDRRPGIVTLVAVMLGSVAFDGFSRSSMWQDKLFSIQGHFSGSDPARVTMIVNLLVLVLVIAIVATVYTLAVLAAERAAEGAVDFDGVFLGSLIPIAFVYVLAHYLTFLLAEGQFVIPRLSDPYGKGWDLFGTLGFVPNVNVLTPNQTWYAQITILVLGHVVGLVVAHDRAVELVSSARLAARTQVAMLCLMVFYTVGGMWLLSLR